MGQTGRAGFQHAGHRDFKAGILRFFAALPRRYQIDSSPARFHAGPGRPPHDPT